MTDAEWFDLIDETGGSDPQSDEWVRRIVRLVLDRLGEAPAMVRWHLSMMGADVVVADEERATWYEERGEEAPDEWASSPGDDDRE